MFHQWGSDLTWGRSNTIQRAGRSLGAARLSCNTPHLLGACGRTRSSTGCTWCLRWSSRLMGKRWQSQFGGCNRGERRVRWVNVRWNSPGKVSRSLKREHRAWYSQVLLGLTSGGGVQHTLSLIPAQHRAAGEALAITNFSDATLWWCLVNVFWHWLHLVENFNCLAKKAKKNPITQYCIGLQSRGRVRANCTNGNKESYNRVQWSFKVKAVNLSEWTSCRRC